MQDHGLKQIGLASLTQPGEACSVVAEAADSRMQAVAVQVGVQSFSSPDASQTPVTSPLVCHSSSWRSGAI